MGRQIRQLTAVSLCNLFGFNVYRHTKDHKIKSRFRLMALAWVVLLAMLIFYIAMLSYAFTRIGLSDVIPLYLYAITAVVILFFTTFKAASVIFQMNTFEMLMSLPVTKTAIVISRFLTMYVTNLFMSVIVMVPGVILYGMAEHPGISFYLLNVIGILFLPLLPITIATAIGALATAVSARMKHKSIISSVLTIGLIMGIFILNTFGTSKLDSITNAQWENLATIIRNQIGRFYPPALWFSNMVLHGNWLLALTTSCLYLGIFGLLIYWIQRDFLSVCNALNATSAKNNYKAEEIKTLKSSSQLIAMTKREMKRYFASSVYVTNTMIGYLFVAALGIAAFAVGIEKLETMMGFSNVLGKAMPYALGLMLVISPPTTSAISMEGKQWWIAKSLPVPPKTILNSKLLMNLFLAAPFTVIGILFSCLAFRKTPGEILWLILIPMVYLLFSMVMGLEINLFMPNMTWENETSVVKQSGAVFIAMLVGMASAMIPMMLVILVPAIPAYLVHLVVALILIVVTIVLFLDINGKQITNIE